MTLEELIIEVHDQLGKPTDLDPYADDGDTVDIGSAGAVRIRGWINRGYRRILNWRFPSGRIVRFRTNEHRLFFSGVNLEGTAAAGGDTTITLDATAEAVADRYNKWAIEITGGTGEGQKRLITDYSAARVATVHKGWSTNPDATSEYELTKNFYDFLPEGHTRASTNIPYDPADEIITVLQVIDLYSGSKLGRAKRTQGFTSVHNAIGSYPSVFADLGGGLLFDAPIPEGRQYEVRYYGMPEELTDLTDEPQMPQQFHEAVLLWAVWWGLRRAQEFAGAYSTKRDLEDTMATALQQFDMSNERDDTSLYMGDKYESVT